MPDDRRGAPRPHLIADHAADRARAHDQRQVIACHREDDTVPLGRPPGVPRTVARDLAAECHAAVASIFAHAGPLQIDITTTESGGTVAIDVGCRVTTGGVDWLLELAASLGTGVGDR